MKQQDPVRAHLHHLSMRGLAPATTIYTRGNVLHRLEAVLQPVPLLAATAADLAAWRASLTQAPSTIAGYISHVKSFYAWALAAGLITADPAAAIPVPKTPRRLPRPISEDALMHALECAPLRIRAWLVLAGWCGLRAKEIALLRGENIRLYDDSPVLLVASDATKGIRERVIPLSPFVTAELTAAGLRVRGLVFRKMNGQPMPPWLVSKLANQHLHDCGIPDTLHSLRHRFLTMAYRGSHDLRLVMELAGHQSPTSTAGYTLLDPTEAVAAVNGLPVPRLPMTG